MTMTNEQIQARDEWVRRVISQEVLSLENSLIESCLAHSDTLPDELAIHFDDVENWYPPMSEDDVFYVYLPCINFPGCLLENDPSYHTSYDSAVDELLESMDDHRPDDGDDDGDDDDNLRRWYETVTELRNGGATYYGGMNWYVEEHTATRAEIAERNECDGFSVQEEFASTEGYDAEYWDTPRDVFQWWAVSDWLFRQLRDIGEPVVEAPWGTCYWGRTCCGQGLEQDGTFQRIYDLLYQVDESA